MKLNVNGHIGVPHLETTWTRQGKTYYEYYIVDLFLEPLGAKYYFTTQFKLPNSGSLDIMYNGYSITTVEEEKKEVDPVPDALTIPRVAKPTKPGTYLVRTYIGGPMSTIPVSYQNKELCFLLSPIAGTFFMVPIDDLTEEEREWSWFGPIK